MLESLNCPEIYRLSLLLGAFIAIKYKNKFGVIPGGIIVPGFIIVLFLSSPIWCGTLVALTFPLYWIYKRFFERADYKRRTPMYILCILSLAIATLIALLYIRMEWLNVSFDNLFGMLIPAIIAFNCTKQKIEKVFIGVVLTTLSTAGIILLIYTVGNTIFGWDFNTLQAFYAGKTHFEIKYQLLQFLIILALGYFIYRFKDVRSGGYMVAPIAAVLLVHPVSALAFLLGCFITYYITKLICNFTLIVGLNRYALALFISTIIVWLTEIIFIHMDSTILPFQDADIFAILAMMSYANDSILFGKKQIFVYIAITVAIAIASLFMVNVLSVIFL